MLRIIRPAIAALVVTLVSGCASTHKLNIDPRLDDLPQTTKVPLRAGIYYSRQFSSQEYTRTSGSDTFVVPIGASSVRMFDDIFPRVFETTTRISNLSEEEFETKGIDVAIAPSLEHFDFFIGFDKDSERYSVVYRMTLYTKQGVPAASWLVPGNKPSKAFGIWRMIENDMTDAAAGFLQDFGHNAGPALDIMEKKDAGEVPAVDLHDVALTAKRTALPGLDPQQLAAMQEAGIVTVEVTALNQTERSLVARASSMRLKLGNGQIVEPLTVSSALSVLDKTSHTGGTLAFFTGAPVGLLATYAEQQSSQAERELQFKAGGQALFEDRLLNKDKEESGIVLFRVPLDMKGTEGSTVLVWVVDPATAEGMQAEVSLPANH